MAGGFRGAHDLAQQGELEKPNDFLLSTLRRTVEAMGGSLSLIAGFPDRPLSSPPVYPPRRDRRKGRKPDRPGDESPHGVAAFRSPRAPQARTLDLKSIPMLLATP